MPRRRPTTHLTLSAGRVLALALAVSPGGCGPGASSPKPTDPIEAFERRSTEGASLASESAVALEYTAADAPLGARRVASGVVINEEGEVLSVRIDPPPAGARPITARVASGDRLTAEWVAADPRTGLTLLRIPPGHARPASPADREAAPGLPLILIGNPFGMGHSVGRGHVAGTGRRLRFGRHALGGLIQVDATLRPGDSGSLVADLRGGWLGLIRSGLASPGPGKPEAADALPDGPTRDERPGRDMGFAIPARHALWVAGQLRAHGQVDRAFLGVVTRPTTSTGRPGVELAEIVPGSPAALGGLGAGDRIVGLSGEAVSVPLDLNDVLDRTAAGDAVTVEYLRDGALARRTLLTARRPGSVQEAEPGTPSGPVPPPDRDAQIARKP